MDPLVFDRVSLPPGQFTGAGGRRGTMVVATAGPLRYGQTIHLADEETLSDPAWLASLAGVPMTVQHDGGRITLDNVERYRVGTILTARYEPDALLPDGTRGPATVADYVLDTKRGLQALDSGVAGVSPGYDRDLLPIETVAAETIARYGPADKVQRNRRANHVSIVTGPRAANAAVLDAEEPRMTPDEIRAAVKAELAGLDIKAIVLDALGTLPAVVQTVAEQTKPPVVTDADEAKARDAYAARYHRVHKAADALGVKADGLTLDAVEAAIIDEAGKGRQTTVLVPGKAPVNGKDYSKPIGAPTVET